MRLSFKIFSGIFLIIGLGAYLFFSSFMQELEPSFRQSTEESLIDVANLLAEQVSDEVKDGVINKGSFATVFKRFQQRDFNAQIWMHTKHHPQLQVYITDAQGMVIYDSLGKNLGADFSNWHDVYNTLRGEYGARSTLSTPDNEIMHIAAPVYDEERNIIGVLTVRKAELSVEPFFKAATLKLTQKGLLLVGLSLLAGIILSWWLSRSLRKLAEYASAVKNGDDKQPPKVYGVELQQLAEAMAAMKTELEGKKYVEQYIHALTHQLKTPIASVHGAASLLTEDMPKAQQQRFIANIFSESLRLQDLIQHMLDLADMENRHTLKTIQTQSLKKIISSICQTLEPVLKQKQVFIHFDFADELTLQGEIFLMTQALSNLLDNAVGFSPQDGEVTITAYEKDESLFIEIMDEGEGIPDYAVERLFERFYSLPKPDSKAKGSGLGLCFVKEIARLHGGKVRLENREKKGVKATLIFHINIT
ncbi:MAG: two-component system sensor histidine kinase CreC [Methylococcaceae bacterium]|nr:two-component system sensor histidine kinase CreC [Methylococcaceae bacterium]